jgi:D-aminopeptidase
MAKRTVSYGSIIAVLATDAPLNSHQLGRVSKRVGLGIGRAGSIAAHGSGEIVLAFSTANKIPRTTKKLVYHLRVLVDDRLNPIYEAAIEATEEAILNSLCMARDMDGANGNFAPALPLAEVKDIVERSAFKMKPQSKTALAPPAKPMQPPPAPRVSESPRVGEAPPSAARGAEGMMTVPLPKPDGSSS